MAQSPKDYRAEYGGAGEGNSRDIPTKIPDESLRDAVGHSIVEGPYLSHSVILYNVVLGDEVEKVRHYYYTSPKIHTQTKLTPDLSQTLTRVTNIQDLSKIMADNLAFALEEILFFKPSPFSHIHNIKNPGCIGCRANTIGGDDGSDANSSFEEFGEK
ncbi:hypothetical protein J4463_00255 [Candidatus Pacearchaeota archaeon]|nr:hypothetical protein [Candidatus Pacearchaeota archaeon]